MTKDELLSVKRIADELDKKSADVSGMELLTESLTTVMDGLTELFSGGDGIGKISEGINGFVDNLSGMLPKVMQTGTKIIMSLGDAIVSNLPVITEAARSTIGTPLTLLIYGTVREARGLTSIT